MTSRRFARRGFKSQRRGSAPLELVMSLPLIVGLLVLIVGLGRAGIAGIQIEIDVRRTAWQERDARRASRPLELRSLSPIHDSALTVAQRPVTGLPRIIPGTYVADSELVTTAGEWSEQDVSLLNERPRWHPHTGLMRRLVGGALTPPPSNSNAATRLQSQVGAARAAQQRLDGARQRVREEDQRVQRELAQVQRELDSLHQRRSAAEKIEDENLRKKTLREIDGEIVGKEQQRASLRAQRRQLQATLNSLP